MQKDYAEILFLSIDEIISKRLEGISYDVTNIVTIVDDSEALKGKYKVSDLTTTYFAYSSDTSYKLDDAVYVTVPNGDYTQQKIILGKYVAKDSKPFVFLSPFETIVDTSGNLIDGSMEQKGLIANNPEAETILLWNKDFTGEKYQLKGYTRLGLQGLFRSWLENFDCRFGNFGYILKVYSDKEITTSTTVAYQKAIESAKLGLIKQGDTYITNTLKLNLADAFYALETKEEQISYLERELGALQGSSVSLLLESNDMYGNPFDFESYYLQEKVFDISSLETITRMELYFFQESGSFLSDKNVPIPYKDEFDMLLSPNLFTKDAYICLGYDISEFADDQATLYTINGTTYTSTNTDAENKKNLLLRWVHERAVILQKDFEALKAEIRWYRYALGAPSADEYSGVYWKRVEATQSTISSASGMEFQFSFIPDVKKSEERIKAIVLYDDKVIASNILTFTNEKEVVNDATKDFLAGLNLWCEDGTYGNYYIYAPGNKILEQFRTTEAHSIKAMFSAEDALLERDGKASALTEAESITWTFSTHNTMIQANNIDYLTKIDEDTTIAPSKFQSRTVDATTGLVTYITTDSTVIYDPNENTISITRYGDAANGYAISADQLYFVKETYVPSALNNVIQCKVVKDGVEYFTSKRLFFGLAGTTGTDATLRIYFDPANKHAVYHKATGGDNSDSLRVRAVLFDSHNKEVDLNDETDFQAKLIWEWYAFSSSGRFIKIEPRIAGSSGAKNNYNLRIINNGETDGNYYLSSKRDEVIISASLFQMTDFMILKVTLKDWGDYDLVTCRPIPVAVHNFAYEGKEYVPRFVDCAEEVIYGTAGYPDYYKDEWALHYAEDENSNGSMDMPNSDKCYWQLWQLEKQDNYTGSFKNNVLSPMPFYVDKAEPYGAQYVINDKIIWSLPIFVLQNNYPSSTLNKWDGKTLTLDYEKGQILATAIAAGSKNARNEFSGVMMGDWEEPKKSESADITKLTGLYGFHEGAMSFAFKEDGTGFIGKSGKGRILFNGDKSTIQSEYYNSSSCGMIIDFDDGFIKMYNSDGKIEIDSSAPSDPFKIGGKFSVDWDGTVNATDGNFEGNIKAKTGTIGCFTITDHSIFAPQDTNVGTAENKTVYNVETYWGRSSHAASTFDFRLGDCLLFKGDMKGTNSNGRLYLAANLYSYKDAQITSASDLTREAKFLFGINLNDNLQIGSAKSGEYKSVNIYAGTSGKDDENGDSAIRLIPEGSTGADFSLKITKNGLWVKGIDASDLHGIYARFA